MHQYVGEVLYCEWEIGNYNDPCAGAMKRTTLRATILVVLGNVTHFTYVYKWDIWWFSKEGASLI